MSRMPIRHYLALSTLSSLGISAVHAGVGAWPASANSAMLAFAASILTPWAAMSFARIRLTGAGKVPGTDDAPEPQQVCCCLESAVPTMLEVRPSHAGGTDNRQVAQARPD